MISLKFQNMQAVRSITLGPREGFRVSGNFMRELPEDTVVAEYARHQWHVKGDSFSRYDCDDPSIVHFMDAEGTASRAFGPFTQIFVADGTLYANGELFAKYLEETLLWHSFEMENYWPVLVISAPG